MEKNEHPYWYIPDDSVSGSDHKEINNFFDRVKKNIIKIIS